MIWVFVELSEPVRWIWTWSPPLAVFLSTRGLEHVSGTVLTPTIHLLKIFLFVLIPPGVTVPFTISGSPWVYLKRDDEFVLFVSQLSFFVTHTHPFPSPLLPSPPLPFARLGIRYCPLPYLHLSSFL